MKLLCPHCEKEECKHKTKDGKFKKEKYTVKFEVLVPAVITYDIELEDPKIVDLNKIKLIRPKHIQYMQPKTIYNKITVYKYLSSIIKFFYKLK